MMGDEVVIEKSPNPGVDVGPGHQVPMRQEGQPSPGQAGVLPRMLRQPHHQVRQHVDGGSDSETRHHHLGVNRIFGILGICANKQTTNRLPTASPALLRSGGRQEGCRGDPGGNPRLGAVEEQLLTHRDDGIRRHQLRGMSQFLTVFPGAQGRQLQLGLGPKHGDSIPPLGVPHESRHARIESTRRGFGRHSTGLVKRPGAAQRFPGHDHLRARLHLDVIQRNSDKGQAVSFEETETLKSRNAPVHTEGTHCRIHGHSARGGSAIPGNPRLLEDLTQLRQRDALQQRRPQFAAAFLLRRPRNRSVRAGRDGEGNGHPGVLFTQSFRNRCGKQHGPFHHENETPGVDHRVGATERGRTGSPCPDGIALPYGGSK